jgi:hypothetical protein
MDTSQPDFRPYKPQVGRADKHQSNVIGPGREGEARAEEKRLADQQPEFQPDSAGNASNSDALYDWDIMIRNSGYPKTEINEFKYGVH